VDQQVVKQQQPLLGSEAVGAGQHQALCGSIRLSGQGEPGSIQVLEVEHDDGDPSQQCQASKAAEDDQNTSHRRPGRALLVRHGHSC
jgi:hypothetical protein